MIKLAGVLAISLATVMTGYCIAAKICKRAEILEQCIALIKRIRSDISYYADPLSVIVDKAGQSSEFSKLSFLNDVSSSENDDLPAAWVNSVEKFYGISPLNRADIDYIKAFGKKLGSTDSEHQKRLCDEYIDILEERLSISKGKKDEQIKLCKICAVALGVFELIMLL